MREAAITLPLDVVERLLELAGGLVPDDAWDQAHADAVQLVKHEVAQVKEMFHEYEAEAERHLVRRI